MINSVAKSIRILGFNTGIEAARSGEHGRGFSVVVKQISKQQCDATVQLSKIAETKRLMT